MRRWSGTISDWRYLVGRVVLAVVLMGGAIDSVGANGTARAPYRFDDRGRWTALPFKVLDLPWIDGVSEFAGSDRPLTVMIGGEKHLLEFWDVVFKDVGPARPEPPKVDFAKKCLVVISMGAFNPAGGERAQVEAAWESDCAVLVQVRETTRCSGFFDATAHHPVTAILLPKTKKPLVVDVKNEIETAN